MRAICRALSSRWNISILSRERVVIATSDSRISDRLALRVVYYEFGDLVQEELAQLVFVDELLGGVIRVFAHVVGQLDARFRVVQLDVEHVVVLFA